MPGAAARGWVSLAARSARGGTTGRAAGCPASGRAGGLGADGMGAPCTAGGAGVPDDAGAMGARADTPGLKMGAEGESGSLRPAGMGWRGPDKTWPGRGWGTGRATGGVGRPGTMTAGVGAVMGVGATRGATGAAGCAPGVELPANGGRMGCAGRPAERSNTVFPAANSGVFSSAATGAGGWPSGPPVITSGAGDGSTTAAGCSGGVAGRTSSPAYSSGTSWPKSRRSLMATSSSIELEWVFFSVTPNSGSLSMISCALTSSSRASSLIRILFIDTKLFRRDAPHSFCEPPSSDSS